MSDPDLGPKTLARAFRLTLDRLYRLFTDTDITVAAFIREERLSHIARALHAPGRPHIADLATRTGFAGPDQMTRAFRQRFGESPTDYWARLNPGHTPQPDHLGVPARRSSTDTESTPPTRQESDR